MSALAGEERTAGEGDNGNGTRESAAPLDLSVVVPAFDEEERLGRTLDAVTRYLSDGAG
ncbi:MAG: hypothetical protein HOV66_11090, partial [Streptomycetaceae bacterium]|nr:hypothetical protein [Streptomycetaceae bacterium]